jgi:hypothetical protein
MLEQVQTTEATQPVTSATTQSTQETSQPILSYNTTTNSAIFW